MRDALTQSRRLVIPEITDRSAHRSPDKTALVFEGASVTFGQLRDRTNRLARALLDRGVSPGDRVAILMYNRIEFVEAFIACQKAGACAVPVNFRMVQAELEYVLGDCGAVGLIADAELAGPAASLAASVPSVRFHIGTGDGDGERYEEVVAAASPDPVDLELDDEMLAFVIYTSGTTGRPKGAMLTHQNLVANTMNWLYEVGASSDDVWLSGLPLFHIGGLNGILPFLHLGATSIVTPSTGFDPVESIALLAEHAVTMCFFVPTQWQEICTAAGIEDLDSSRLRVAMWGASIAPRPTLELLIRTFPNVQIVNAFGQTEMSSNTAFLKGADAVRKMGSIGRPAINVGVRIVDADGRDVPQGQVGEIVYRGPTVMAGYLGKPEATAEAFRDGWFHSGDLVYEDDEGFMYVADRLKDMIISGGENIYPAEVEAALLEHPAVSEVAVVGVPHPRWVETPVAVVVASAGAVPSGDELVAHCKERLAGYKKPSEVVFVEQLPRNATGKVLKHELRSTYGDLFAAKPV